MSEPWRLGLSLQGDPEADEMIVDRSRLHPQRGLDHGRPRFQEYFLSIAPRTKT
jgi:hypothetical protein